MILRSFWLTDRVDILDYPQSKDSMGAPVDPATPTTIASNVPAKLLPKGMHRQNAERDLSFGKSDINNLVSWAFASDPGFTTKSRIKFGSIYYSIITWHKYSHPMISGETLVMVEARRVID